MSPSLVVSHEAELLCQEEQLSPRDTDAVSSSSSSSSSLSSSSPSSSILRLAPVLVLDDAASELEALLAKEGRTRDRRSGEYLERVQTQGMQRKWRALCCRWMFDTGKAFELSPDTIMVAIHFMDQYLSTYSADKVTLQLICMVCMFAASKMHETHSISMEELDLLCQGKFPRATIVAMETKLLQVLEWNLNPITAMTVARHIAQHLALDDTVEAAVIAHLEESAQDYDFVKFRASSVAFAAVRMVVQTTRSLALQRMALRQKLQKFQARNDVEFVECYRLMLSQSRPDHAAVEADRSASPSAVEDVTQAISPRVSEPLSPSLVDVVSTTKASVSWKPVLKRKSCGEHESEVLPSEAKRLRCNSVC